MRCARSGTRLFAGLALAAAVLAVASAPSPCAPEPTVQVVADLSTRTVRSEESGLANVLVDAVRAAERTDIAWLAATAFVDVTVPKGPAEPSSFVAALANPADKVVVSRLTGEQVRKALERSVSMCPQRSMAFLQVSGLSFTFDPGAGKENKVMSVRIGKAPLDPTKTYTVAMPAPLADGALAYGAVWDPEDVERRTDRSLADAVRAYLTPGRTVGAKADDRITARK